MWLLSCHTWLLMSLSLSLAALCRSQFVLESVCDVFVAAGKNNLKNPFVGLERCLRWLAAFAGDPSLDLSTMSGCSPMSRPTVRGSDTLFWPPRALNAHKCPYDAIYFNIPQTHIKLNNKNPGIYCFDNLTYLTPKLLNVKRLQSFMHVALCCCVEWKCVTVRIIFFSTFIFSLYIIFLCVGFLKHCKIY